MAFLVALDSILTKGMAYKAFLNFDWDSLTLLNIRPFVLDHNNLLSLELALSQTSVAASHSTFKYNFIVRYKNYLDMGRLAKVSRPDTFRT